MACKTVCKLCKRLVISQAVTYASGVLTINLPAGAYLNGEKYCIVVAQAIPDTAIINAPVVITIGTAATTYPLLTRNCANVVAAGLRTRTRYATVVATSATGGAFRLLGNPSCTATNTRQSIGG